MCPRPYRLGKRRDAAAATGARILAAARDVFAAGDGLTGFTVDAVARRAGVARMTVYYRFGSRDRLLEALFDDLAGRGRLSELLPAAFAREDPLEALDGFVHAFATFWSADRLAMRHLRALAALDPALGAAVRARDDRRREGLRVLAGRLAARYGVPPPAARDEAVDVLFALTGFEHFDALAGDTRPPQSVAPAVVRLARLALGLPPPGAGGVAGDAAPGPPPPGQQL
jgi:AcrR family transcriptional regulator